jgi:hypothetical protein
MTGKRNINKKRTMKERRKWDKIIIEGRE